jgi:hypothetical protein
LREYARLRGITAWRKHAGLCGRIIAVREYARLRGITASGGRQAGQGHILFSASPFPQSSILKQQVLKKKFTAKSKKSKKEVAKGR